MSHDILPMPEAGAETGLTVLKQVINQRSLLVALEIMHQEVGNAFRVTLPSFKPAVLAGPESNRAILVTDRDKFLWRNEADPVTRLLRHGILVEDGDNHDRLRDIMNPALHRQQVNVQVEGMWRHTDMIMATWSAQSTVDMLVEMRRIALLILMDSLFSVDFQADMRRMWDPILKAIKFISPGMWIIWPKMPRVGYGKALSQLDAYLYEIIARRRAARVWIDDLLGRLIDEGLDDDSIRDQMLTMLIAGHDTSTALLAWSLYLLGSHPDEMARARQEVDRVLGHHPPAVEHVGALDYLGQVIKEALRLYPPIHVGNRFTVEDTPVAGYLIPGQTRTMYSIYLTHRDPAVWPDPAKFCPARFDHQAAGPKRPALSYVPFGGGPRNCIGATFAQVEVKIVLARILQRYELELISQDVRTYMGATLEPRPGVMMRVSSRRKPDG